LSAADIGAAAATHKSQHATGGADALSAADIGAAATSHNHTEISNASAGGNGSADAGKLAKFGTGGVLSATSELRVVSLVDSVPFPTVIYNYGVETSVSKDGERFDGQIDWPTTADPEDSVQGVFAITDQPDGKTNLATCVTGILPVANGGTGGATQADARAGLGIGTKAAFLAADQVGATNSAAYNTSSVSVALGMDCAALRYHAAYP
jgi:hypothetical protein